jgi:benzil reductase ((S)-benzoin forming)
MKIAVVTGASSGIGKKTAELLLQDGWKVYGIARRKPDIKNGDFIWLECDLAEPKTITSSLKAITEPIIDALYSNAGVAFEEPASEATEESYDKMFSVNVLAPMLLVHELKGKLTKATIISISSVSDRIADKDFALYCSSKAANTRYFESLADELKQAKVYSLLPDYVDTPMLRELQAGRNFKWEETIKVDDVAQLSFELMVGKTELETGSNVIIVNDALIDDLNSFEKLHGFNTDTGKLFRLNLVRQ